jgi:hypothetical protein
MPARKVAKSRRFSEVNGAATSAPGPRGMRREFERFPGPALRARAPIGVGVVPLLGPGRAEPGRPLVR